MRRVAGEEDPAESVGVGLAAVADGAADRGGFGEGQVRAEDPVQAGAQVSVSVVTASVWLDKSGLSSQTDMHDVIRSGAVARR